MSPFAFVETWTYTVDGVEYEGRKVWHVEPPAPKGSGIVYHESEAKDILGDDNVWERHVYRWVLHSVPCPQPNCEYRETP